jgi:hypothetical protein
MTKHVPAFTLINLADGEPYPWALMCTDISEHTPLAHFETEAEAIAVLNECIRVAASKSTMTLIIRPNKHCAAPTGGALIFARQTNERGIHCAQLAH